MMSCFCLIEGVFKGRNDAKDFVEARAEPIKHRLCHFGVVAFPITSMSVGWTEPKGSRPQRRIIDPAKAKKDLAMFSNTFEQRLVSHCAIGNALSNQAPHV